MEIRVGEQALALALAFGLGLGTGLMYDMLRPLRRRGGKPLAAVTDAVFALASAFCLFLFAMQADNGRLGTWELAAALLGFLLYNHYPARVFMGDTGSLYLGGAVCAMAFVYDMPLILVPVELIYIIETLSDILQVGYYKISGGKRIFKMAPIHHHFGECGWSGRKIVAVFTAITALCCALTLLFA